MNAAIFFHIPHGKEKAICSTHSPALTLQKMGSVQAKNTLHVRASPKQTTAHHSSNGVKKSSALKIRSVSTTLEPEGSFQATPTCANQLHMPLRREGWPCCTTQKKNYCIHVNNTRQSQSLPKPHTTQSLRVQSSQIKTKRG